MSKDGRREMRLLVLNLTYSVKLAELSYKNSPCPTMPMKADDGDLPYTMSKKKIRFGIVPGGPTVYSERR